MTDREPVHVCESCGKPLYEGDKVQFCGEDLAFCEEHAWYLSQIIGQWEEDLAKGDDDAEPYWPEWFADIDQARAHVDQLRDQLERDGDHKVLSEV